MRGVFGDQQLFGAGKTTCSLPSREHEIALVGVTQGGLSSLLIADKEVSRCTHDCAREEPGGQPGNSRSGFPTWTSQGAEREWHLISGVSEGDTHSAWGTRGNRHRRYDGLSKGGTGRPSRNVWE